MFPTSSLTNTFGAYTIATFASAILFGVSCFQAWHYFNTYSDAPILKYTVGALVALEMLHLAVSIHALYYFLITNYLNPFALLQNVWWVADFYLTTEFILRCHRICLRIMLKLTLGIIGLIMTLVHLCYAMRIYHVSGRKKIVPIAIAVVSLIPCAIGWVVVAVLFRDRLNAHLPGLPETLAKALLAAAIAIDVFIAYTLSYYLHTNRSGMKQ
ncbi:hypothetical protein GALMADRAFT_144760 [Galerina marginata CBS 339.88]|uniref:Uncharacterized protein n=1 Tax=Galerina marginata (strain CBS 339.88) TaxID=685588 RepID=A0A067SHS9_GALM3|nr:hypothetical protein GALMADRAFT_144760 [Galerina marginata CBS 339.88]